MSEHTFNGTRLRSLREARQLTATYVAERAGVSSSSMTQYEHDRRQPSAHVASQLAQVLGVHPSYFYGQDPPYEPQPCRWRSLASTTKRARDGALVRLGWLEGLLAYLSQFVYLPTANVPRPGTPADPAALDMNEIEDVVDDVRAAWRLGGGPVTDVVRIMEVHGIVVSRFSFGASNIDGVSTVGVTRPLAVLNSEKATRVRSRFDAAHELGHLVLHEHAPERPDTTTHKLMEMQAHRFASAFLLPRRAFEREVYSVQPTALLDAKSRWGISMQATLRRALDLGLIDRDRYRSVQIELSRRGYRRGEPLDNEWEVEQPSLLRKSVELLQREGIATLDDIARDAGIPLDDLRILANLPPDDEDEPEVEVRKVLEFRR